MHRNPVRTEHAGPDNEDPGLTLGDAGLVLADEAAPGGDENSAPIKGPDILGW